MSDMQINQVLSQIRAMTALAQGNQIAAAGASPGVERPDFAALLQDSVNKVNDTQQTGAKLAAAFEAGDPNVDLAEVMVALQKSNLSFQALTTVRNKLISAYQEIMSMPV